MSMQDLLPTKQNRTINYSISKFRLHHLMSRIKLEMERILAYHLSAEVSSSERSIAALHVLLKVKGCCDDMLLINN